MMTTILTKLLITVVIIALISILQNIISSRKSRRIRQFPLVIISIFCAIYEVLYIRKYPEKITEIYNYLKGKKPSFENSYILVLNAVIILCFVIFKLVVRPILSYFWKNDVLLQFSALCFYDYDEQYSEWFLNTKWRAFRKFFLAILCGFILGCSIFLSLTWLYGPNSYIWIILYPGAGLLVVNEIFNYLNGQTKEEYEHSIMGDEADARRISNYYKLRDTLEQLLADPVLSSQNGSEFTNKESATELLKKYKRSDDVLDQAIYKYFMFEKRYRVANVDYVNATSQLVHGNNVIFLNPFYRDLSMYIILPLMNTLLSGGKCLVMCGRKSISEDVKRWIENLLIDYTHMNSLWRVGTLSEQEPDFEVGILTFTQVFDKNIIGNNRKFMKDVRFSIIIEPSIILNTSQIALSIIAQEMVNEGKAPFYCICDRNVDGLVDTLSHVLRIDVADVIAMSVPHCNYTAMSWDADGDFGRQHLFDKQTKYLGNGVELAAIAIKNQIPKVVWYGESKSPIKDIKWIAGQHYSTICRYMNLPNHQKNVYEKIEFKPNLWCAEKTKEDFLIVEDEFCNMFSMMRLYLSRGEMQSFVNVLSEDYILRDYMRCNKQMFMSNPNAVPSLTADYAKTERNIILKLILMMTLHPVHENEVLSELNLAGIETHDAFGTMSRLLRKYTFADDSIFNVNIVRKNMDEYTTVTSSVFSVSPGGFDKYFADSLRNAFFIIENEKSNEGYIEAKLFSHVTQTVLPGQYVVYDGKYYVVKHISPDAGVILRRASDLYDGRKYYRQIRKYYFDHPEKDEILSLRKIADVEFAEIRKNIHVDTDGYLEMEDSHNLRTARLIDLSNDPNVGSYSRKYRNKTVLRIKFPDTDNKIRFTICMLLSEIMKSVFPNAWQYIAVVTTMPDDIDGMLNYIIYTIDGIENDEYIYIIEDSDIDLGLLDAIQRNFTKIMEIMADFLDWHYEKMKEPASKDPQPVKRSALEAAEKKKRTLIVRMFDRIRKLFGGKPEEEVRLESLPSKEDIDTKKDTKPVNKQHIDNQNISASKDSSEREAINDAELEEGVISAPISVSEDGTKDNTYELDSNNEDSSTTNVEPSSVSEMRIKLDSAADNENKSTSDNETVETTTKTDIETSKKIEVDDENASNIENPDDANINSDKTENNNDTSEEQNKTIQSVDSKIILDTNDVKAELVGSDAIVTVDKLNDDNKQNESNNADLTDEGKKEEQVENTNISRNMGNKTIVISENTLTQNGATIDSTEFEPDFLKQDDSDPDLVHIDGTDIFDEDSVPDDNDYFESNFELLGLTPITKSKYQKSCFLKFGFEEIDSRVHVDDVHKYLRVRGYCNNSLKLARIRDAVAKTHIDLDAVNHCDFCAMPISGVSYERLNDGRIRCNDCSSSAITTLEDFRELFFRSLDMMEDLYGVSFKIPIGVKMADAITVAKGYGSVFKPSTNYATRVLGFAQVRRGKYNILMENGSPRLASIDTMVHELTHIWQYLNWDEKQIKDIYKMRSDGCSKKARDIVYEGMAMWAAIQYLYQIGENYYASQQEAINEARYDIYGIGFRLYRDRYPFVKDSSILKYSPFSYFPTLEPKDVIAEVRKICTEENCIC